MELTIVIPTKNRPKFVLRQINYLIEQKYNGKIIICDSSNYKNHKLLADYFKNISGIASLIYKPDFGADEFYAHILGEVQTDFVVLLPDDDMIVVSTLNHLLDFLNHNTEYVAANGNAYEFSVSYGRSKDYGRIQTVTKTPIANYCQDNAFDRINEYFGTLNNVNMSVMRTEIARKSFSFTSRLNKYFSTFVYGETISSIIALSMGKIATLNYDYLIRQVHSNQNYDNLNIETWITTNGWSESLRYLEDVLNQIGINKSDVSLLLSKFLKPKIFELKREILINPIKKFMLTRALFNMYRPYKNLLKRGIVDIHRSAELKNYLNYISKKK